MSVIVGSLAAGMAHADVEREYDLSADDIRAALEFANSLVEREAYHPLPS